MGEIYNMYLTLDEITVVDAALDYVVSLDFVNERQIEIILKVREQIRDCFMGRTGTYEEECEKDRKAFYEHLEVANRAIGEGER